MLKKSGNPRTFNYYLLLIAAFTMVMQSCSEQRMVAQKVRKEFKGSAIIDKYQVGFALYDISKAKMVFMKDGHKYFTPASNTKLYTFYGSLKMLPDSVPALRYIERGDSLIFWGTGDPSFLQSQLKGMQAYNFLKTSGKQLFFAPGRYTGDFYGAGWQWDDYNDDYQAEIDEMPMMDNLVSIKAGAEDKLSISPPAFAADFIADSSMAGNFRVIRDFNSNIFKYPANPVKKMAADYNQHVPFKVSLQNTLALLADTLKKPVGTINMILPPDAHVIYGLKRDSVLKQMLQPSDNFIAEQLILLCSDQLGAELNTRKTIAHIQSAYLSALPDKPVWVDGSGLSRYNLFTPADMIGILDLLYKEFKDPADLFGMLPAGGKTGTLKNAYPATNTPFVFGKTGTVSNNHNQSGYILTNKGKTYIYSFMNNNFVVPTSEVRKEMARIVTFIHENF